RGKFPWSLKNTKPDHSYLQPADQCQRIDYPKQDGVLIFDRLSSVYLTNTNHEEHQPVHLTLTNPDIPVEVNLKNFAGPEARYCPAGIYELNTDEERKDHQQTNPEKCSQSKTSAIKDRQQYIVWTTPQEGKGAVHSGMYYSPILT